VLDLLRSQPHSADLGNGLFVGLSVYRTAQQELRQSFRCVSFIWYNSGGTDEDSFLALFGYDIRPILDPEAFA
jgi:hypothetical protein